MKRISRIVLLTSFSLIVLGTTQSFAGGKGNDKGNSQSQNQGNNNNQGSNSSGGILGWIDGILQDIFGGGDSNKGSNGSGSTPGSSGTPGTSNGGGTAPIDGGISLLLVAGVGLGVRKMARRKDNV
jgi:hypothetical protein